MTEWQPIETAPRDGIIIVCARNEPFKIKYDRGWWWEIVSDCLSDDGYEYYNGVHEERIHNAFTHWLPLPPMPTQEEQPA